MNRKTAKPARMSKARPGRPELKLTLSLCSRTLSDTQSPVIKVANKTQQQLTQKRQSKQPIDDWADDLELEILVAFGIDPKRYKVRMHVLEAPHADCPELNPVRELNYIESQLVEAAFEVHFILRDGIPAPTVEELRQWQAEWAVTIADPAPASEKRIFTFCEPRLASKRLEFASLTEVPKGDIESSLRQGLGLVSDRHVFKRNLAKALDIDLAKNEMTYHFGHEECAQRRNVDDLRTNEQQSGSVKMHVRPKGA